VFDCPIISSSLRVMSAIESPIKAISSRSKHEKSF
jgi:hypothetical protein